MRILHLIDTFDDRGCARQLKALGAALAQGGETVEVCCLGPETPRLEMLRRAGVGVHVLNWTRWFDPRVIARYRETLRAVRPDVVHAWGLSALRVAFLAGADLTPRVLASEILPARGTLAWWDRLLLDRVPGIACRSEADRRAFARLGVDERRLFDAPPVLEAAPPGDAPEPTEEARVPIACVGRLDVEHGFREAVWALEFLRIVMPEVRLQIVGEGWHRPFIERVMHGLGSTANVQFLGALEDPSAVLASAAVVWVPSLANCGRQTALEAMALGRPVVASDVPCVRDLIVEGETGFLCRPGDPHNVARRTLVLLRDAALRARIGASARARVHAQFAREATVPRWRKLYQTMAA